MFLVQKTEKNSKIKKKNIFHFFVQLFFETVKMAYA